MRIVDNQVLPVGTLLQGKVYAYRIQKVLGQGSFGITYLASTRMRGPLGEITVPVALKEFFAKELDTRLDDGTVSARSTDGIAHKYARAFQRESENLSKMEHPGIVNVLESFDAKGTYYYSMEYLSGGSLEEKIMGEGLPEDEALSLIEMISEALIYMHGHKVMHLDLKPRNIMLKDDGSPAIIDFGLSKQYDDNGEPESSSTIGLGTPGFAPLEQANQTSGKSFQPTLDIYALGATLYKMLTGATPPTASEILNEGFPVSALRARGVSDETIIAIRAAMAEKKRERPQSVTEFMRMLKWDDGTAVPVPDSWADENAGSESGSGSGSGSPNKSMTWLWALLAGIALCVIALSVLLGTRGRHDLSAVPMDTLAVDTVAIPDPAILSQEPVSLDNNKVTSTPSSPDIEHDGKDAKKTSLGVKEIKEVKKPLTAHNIHLTGYNTNDRPTDRVANVSYLVVNLTLDENVTIQTGPLRVYAVFRGVGGGVIASAYSTIFTHKGNQMIASASRELDYEGEDVELAIYMKNVGELLQHDGPGFCSVELYTDDAYLGKARLYLREQDSVSVNRTNPDIEPLSM